MICGSHKLSEIISNIKLYGDKCSIGYNEGVYTSTFTALKFIKSIDQEPKLKSGTTDLNGKSIVSFLPISSSKLNPSRKAYSSYRSSSGLLPLPISIPTCHHCGELPQFRPHNRKLMSHPRMKVNVIFSSFSPTCPTP